MTEVLTLPSSAAPLFRKINSPTLTALFLWTVADKQGGFIGKRRIITARELARMTTRNGRGTFISVKGIEQLPVVLATWYDAKAYCSWAKKRFPTEAE